MKKLLFLFLLALTVNTSIAQPALSSRITTLRSINRAWYLYDTGFRRQNVYKHFRINDSLALYDSLMYASLSSAGNLQAVLNAGHTAVNGGGNTGAITLQDLSSNISAIQPNSIAAFSPTYETELSGTGLMFKKLGFPYTTTVNFVTPSANRFAIFPDEGSVSDVSGSTIVLHRTKSYIEVYNAAGYSTLANLGYFGVTDPTHNAVELANTGTPTMQFIDGAGTGYKWKIQMPSGMTNNRTITPLDATGWHPVVVARGRSNAQTAAVSSVATVSVPTDRTYKIECNVLVTTSSAENFAVKVDYTDEAGNAQTQTIPFIALNGSFAPAITSSVGAFPYAGITTTIRAGALSTITVKTAGTFTGCTYNVEASITQISNN